MKKILVVITSILCVLFNAFACAQFDESMIPPPIDEETLNLSTKTSVYEYTLTGVRFDLDDENMPVIIVKVKRKNVSDRSVNNDFGLWPFSHDPYALHGSMLRGGASHYQKEYLGMKITKTKKGKIRKERDNKNELAPGEEYESEAVYQIDNFSDPVYMYFPTKANSVNMKWLKETVCIIPETGEVTRVK